MPWQLLAGVADEEVRQLKSVARRRRFARGEVVFHQGDPGDSLHLVQSGRLVVSVAAPRGNTTSLAVLGAGDSFGEMALVEEHPIRSATVTALEAAETWSVYRTDFHRLRAQHPAVNELLMQLLAARVRVMNERLVEALYLDADTRIRLRVAELAEIYADPRRSETLIPLTQEQIAELAGTSRATVNRVLHEDAARGLVELGRGRITVHGDADEPEAARRRSAGNISTGGEGERRTLRS
jgi:CRP/FNR family cyclic AMP-dependent transcriptional regulator